MPERVALAAIVATLAFWAYTQTLLPGVDLGDTGGFQAAVLWPEVSARQAYPLYYGLARPFVRLTSPENPARALNLFSAVWAAAAVGLLTLVCASVTRSLAAGAVAGTLMAFSYTFWTQAVIAEVYTLHLTLVGICLLALHAYAIRPTTARLLTFFGVYALSFGNHLSMILLLVPFALFLLQTHPAPRELFRPRLVTATAVIVAVGALQYTPNFMAVWGAFTAPESWGDRIAAFWFDVSKQDWRETMVLGIGPEGAGDRLAMWGFDARQQFGVFGLTIAAAGALGLFWTARPWAVLMLTAYASTTAFALTYNVGDSHVFFLLGHYLTAFCAGAAVALVRLKPDTTHGVGRTFTDRLTRSRAAPYGDDESGSARLLRRVFATGVLVIALAHNGWRGWSTWPAADRHEDRRGEDFVAQLARGLGEKDTLLVTELNWQLENVLLYTARHARADLSWVRLGDVMTHWPFVVEDNRRIGRDIVLNARAAAQVVAAYGPQYPMVEENAGLGVQEALAQIPQGMPYVLSVLTPSRDDAFDPGALDAGLSALTRDQVPPRVPSAYELLAGIAGDRPSVYRSSNRPFTERFAVAGDAFTVRMDSWLPTDTFRRGGFGHVVRAHSLVLTIERGVSLVWFERDGEPSRPYYAASLFAFEPRYRIPAATLELAGGPVAWPDVRPSVEQGALARTLNRQEAQP